MTKSEKPNIREMALKHGIQYPTDEELIMMILGSGTKKNPVKKLARTVIEALNDSNEEDVIENLLAVQGMGQGKALAIAASIELGRRRNNHKNAVINRPVDIIPFVKNYAMNPKEHFLCVSLNGGHEILEIRVVAIGSINSVPVHPREIYSEAIKQNAAAIIVCHNHPSGDCSPSRADIETTKMLFKCSELLGITLLDHIIFDKNSYFSFLENKLVFTEQNTDDIMTA